MKKTNDYKSYAKKRQKDILSGAMKSHSLVEKPAMEKLLPSLKGQSVLMLGCGTGDESRLIKKCGAKKIAGIDISKTSIELAKKAYPNCKFYLGDINNLDFKNASFDFVYSSLAINYANDPLRVYKEVFRVLKSKGGFLFSLPHPIRWSSEKIIIDEKPLRIIGFSSDKNSPDTYGDYMNYRKYKHTYDERSDEALEFWVGPPSLHFHFLKEAGFIVEDFVETRAIEEAQKIDRAYYEKYSKLPQFVIFLAAKP